MVLGIGPVLRVTGQLSGMFWRARLERRFLVCGTESSIPTCRPLLLLVAQFRDGGACQLRLTWLAVRWPINAKDSGNDLLIF